MILILDFNLCANTTWIVSFLAIFFGGMSQVCDLCKDKRPSYGNNVSHSKRRTRRRFVPNIKSMRLRSDVLGIYVHVRIAVSTLRTITKYGGFDGYLLAMKASRLSDFGLKMKRAVKKMTKNDATLIL